MNKALRTTIALPVIIVVIALESGTFSSQQTAKELAQFVMTINQGLRVSSRKDISKKDLQNILTTTTSVLGLAA
mgnify:CR=1 FL=1